MAIDADERTFGPEEWSACLKVLEALGDQPEAAPDPERIGRLVSRLYRKTRRRRRKADAQDRRQQDRALIEQTGRVHAVPRPEPPHVEQPEGLTAAGLLRSRSRRCYICKGQYREVHPFYHLLCPPCARLNEAKRYQRADLSGRRAIVTGGRIKIGYQAALKLLRDGAEVLVTTRFPNETALRYAGEPDFDAWRGRLRIERLDLRDLRAVVAFADGLLAGLPTLDILINNAAQTVRRPPRVLRRGRGPGADRHRGPPGEHPTDPRCRTDAGIAWGGPAVTGRGDDLDRMDPGDTGSPHRAAGPSRGE